MEHWPTNRFGLVQLKEDPEVVIKKFYHGKTILITGASMGIGKGLALKLSQYNTNLILCARSIDLLNSVAAECKSNGANEVLVVQCDVTKQEQCKNVVEQGAKKFGGIDILLLNAGISGSIKFEDIKDLNLFDKMMQVNFMGYVNMAYYALPWLKKSKNGRIGVMSSMSGIIGVPFRTAYCASKYAVNGFFETLRNELGKQSPLKISVILPGWVDTELRSHHIVEQETHQYTDKKKFMSVEDCVHGTLYAVAIGKREEKFELKQRIVPLLKAISPSIVDGMITRHVNMNSKL